MNRLHHLQRYSRCPHVLMLLAMLAAMASVRPAQATAPLRLVKDINLVGPSSLGPHAYFTALGSTLFFSADDGVHGRELWTSDGTPSGTTLVQDLSPGAANAEPSQFTRIGTTVFFSAQTPTTGMELWATLGPPFLVYLPLTRR